MCWRCISAFIVFVTRTHLAWNQPLHLSQHIMKRRFRGPWQMQHNCGRLTGKLPSMAAAEDAAASDRSFVSLAAGVSPAWARRLAPRVSGASTGGVLSPVLMASAGLGTGGAVGGATVDMIIAPALAADAAATAATAARC